MCWLSTHLAWCALYAARRLLSSMGTAGGAVAERAARRTRAQYGGGGVIHMDKGAVLFDGVAISGTEAAVRTGGRRCEPGPMRVGGAGAACVRTRQWSRSRSPFRCARPYI